MWKGLLFLAVVFVSWVSCQERAPDTIESLITSDSCSISRLREISLLSIRELECAGDSLGVNLVSIEMLQDVRFNVPLNSVNTTMALPYLQLPAREALKLAVENSNSSAPKPLLLKQAFNSLPQAYVLWRWSLMSKCGLAPSDRVQPARPKDFSSFDNGVVIELQSDPDVWAPYLAEQKWVRLQEDDFPAVFSYRGDGMRDLSYRLTTSFQNWWNTAAGSDTMQATGLFDAETQLRMEQVPLTGWLPLSCTAPELAAQVRTLARASDTPALLLVIGFPVAFFTFFIASTLCFVFLGREPRGPLASRRRAYADPNWLPQSTSSDMRPLVPVSAQVLRDWEEESERSLSELGVEKRRTPRPKTGVEVEVAESTSEVDVSPSTEQPSIEQPSAKPVPSGVRRQRRPRPVSSERPLVTVQPVEPVESSSGEWETTSEEESTFETPKTTENLEKGHPDALRYLLAHAGHDVGEQPIEDPRGKPPQPEPSSSGEFESTEFESSELESSAAAAAKPPKVAKPVAKAPSPQAGSSEFGSSEFETEFETETESAERPAKAAKPPTKKPAPVSEKKASVGSTEEESYWEDESEYSTSYSSSAPTKKETPAGGRFHQRAGTGAPPKVEPAATSGNTSSFGSTSSFSDSATNADVGGDTDTEEEETD